MKIKLSIFRYVSMIFMLAILQAACHPKTSTMNKEKQPDTKTENNTSIISAPVVSKRFIKKNGELTDRKEYYVQRSIQDYFIKFCESQITKEDLEEAMQKVESDFIKALKLEVEFKEGPWDICDDNIQQQSRIGAYIIIHKIIA